MYVECLLRMGKKQKRMVPNFGWRIKKKTRKTKQGKTGNKRETRVLHPNTIQFVLLVCFHRNHILETLFSFKSSFFRVFLFLLKQLQSFRYLFVFLNIVKKLFLLFVLFSLCCCFVQNFCYSLEKFCFLPPFSISVHFLAQDLFCLDLFHIYT